MGIVCMIPNLEKYSTVEMCSLTRWSVVLRRSQVSKMRRYVELEFPSDDEPLSDIPVEPVPRRSE